MIGKYPADNNRFSRQLLSTVSSILFISLHCHPGNSKTLNDIPIFGICKVQNNTLSYLFTDFIDMDQIVEAGMY